jgi:hypothetical protein
MFSKFREWVNGTFICKKCGRTCQVMSFGSGSCICPDCYTGEDRFLFFDGSYFLNRLLLSLIKY